MRHGGGGKSFICWVLTRFESLCALKNSLQSSLKFVLQSSKNQILVVLNLFQHLTSLEVLLAFNKILNSLKITDKSPYFLRFQNDTKIIFDFNSSPNEERICGRTTQLIANSDIPPQRGRLGGVQPPICYNQFMEVRCKNHPRQTSSFNTILEVRLKKC